LGGGWGTPTPTRHVRFRPLVDFVAKKIELFFEVVLFQWVVTKEKSLQGQILFEMVERDAVVTSNTTLDQRDAVGSHGTPGRRQTRLSGRDECEAADGDEGADGGHDEPVDHLAVLAGVRGEVQAAEEEHFGGDDGRGDGGEDGEAIEDG